MSNQNNNRDFNYQRSISVESRGDLIVPTHHSRNVRSVFAPTANLIKGPSPAQMERKIQPVIDDVISNAPAKSLVEQPRKPVFMDDLLKKQAVASQPLVQPIHQIVPIQVKSIPTPVPAKETKAVVDHNAATEKNLTDNKTTRSGRRQLIKLSPKVASLHKKVKTHIAKAAQRKKDLSQYVKSQKIKDDATKIAVYHRAAETGGFTNSVLASAAATIPSNTNRTGAPVAIDNGGIAVANSNDFISGLAKLNSKVTLQFNIDHRKIAKFFKYLIIISVIGISGYLAWDTWAANKPIDRIFSQMVGAVSIDDTNPFNVDPTTVSSQAWAAHTAPADQPRYLSMPSIGIKSRVDSVGINSRGNIDSPKNVNDAAWYDGSAKPGQDGQVFINGNKSYSSSYEAAFDELDQLKVGDGITIENGNGDILKYKVVSNQTVDTDKVDMNKALNVPDGAKQGLTLMTYSGKYNYREQSAEKRVIVYAVRE